MKKIIFGLLVAFVALSFMGCPTTYEDGKFEYATATAFYIGSSTNWTDWLEMKYDEATGLNVVEVEVKAGDNFKLTSKASWDKQWDNTNLDESCANADFLDDPIPEYGQFKTCFADAGKYKISMNVAAEKFTIEKL